MTVNERLIKAVSPVVSVCVPDVYDPNQNEAADEFCVFSYDESASFYADNVPMLIQHTISLVWAMPIKRPSLVKKRLLAQRLTAAGFEVQEILNTSTEEFQMYEFSLGYTEFLEDES